MILSDREKNIIDIVLLSSIKVMQGGNLTISNEQYEQVRQSVLRQSVLTVLENTSEEDVLNFWKGTS